MKNVICMHLSNLELHRLQIINIAFNRLREPEVRMDGMCAQQAFGEWANTHISTHIYLYTYIDKVSDLSPIFITRLQDACDI